MTMLLLPPLVDHHCHGVLRTDPVPTPDLRGSFEAFLTESDAPAAPGTTFFDSQLGFAVRRWCPPLLGLEPHCPPDQYLARRHELGALEATQRLLRADGIAEYVVDTGLPGDLTTPGELGAHGNGTAHEVVRLERLAERVADTARSAESFLSALAEAVAGSARTAVGFKSVAAYRYGLDLAPEPPGRAEVREAAERWLAQRAADDRPSGGHPDPGPGPGRPAGAPDPHPGHPADVSGARVGRVTHPVLLRHLLWSAVRTGLPLQLHTGYGDPDLRLHRADPLLLTDFVRAVRPTGCPLILLHGYPYHRHSAYLAGVFPHVYADVGLALAHTGARAEAVLAEVLELVPFGKLLFSTDAYGLPELYVVGERVFREGFTRLLTRWVSDGAWSSADAQRVADLVGAENARRVYGLHNR